MQQGNSTTFPPPLPNETRRPNRRKKIASLKSYKFAYLLSGRFGALAFVVASANQEIGVPGRADLPIGIEPQLTVAARTASFRSANLRCIRELRARDPNSFFSQSERV